MPTTETPEPTLAVRTPRADVVPAPARTPRRILVLGATSGIAEACCRLWAARGDHLFLVARNAEKLNAVAADLSTRGAASVGTAVADLDNTAAHPELLAHCINALAASGTPAHLPATLDIALVALGVLGDQSDAEANFPAAQAILHTNFTAPASLLTWLGNYCGQRHAGTLAVLSSVAGERGRKSNYIYGSAKAGLTAFTGGLRNRLDRLGVRVITIKPGPVRTSMTDGMAGSGKFADPEAVATTLVRAIDRAASSRDGASSSGPDILYVPGIWRVIMAVIRAIPERIFKNLNL